MGLPGEDGNALMRTLRADEARSGRPATPAVALSAYGDAEARAQALAAGFDQYRVKPITPDALVAVLQALAVQG